MSRQRRRSRRSWCARCSAPNLWDEVKDRLDASALELSGGQQQRLCIARALASSPDILLLDEPASALDPIATAKLEETIRELAEEVTVLLVTHNLQQAARVAHRTAFLYLGELVEEGETTQLFCGTAREADRGVRDRTFRLGVAMLKNHLEHDLEELKKLLLTMAGEVERQLDLAVRALVERDSDLAAAGHRRG